MVVSQLEQLKAKIREALPELDLVIGWEQGYDPLRMTPLFIRKEEDIDRLVLNPLCVQNLASYLNVLKDKKVGIVVKGGEARSIVELLQEKLIERENVVIFGVPNVELLDLVKVRKALGKDANRVEAVEITDSAVNIKAGGKDYNLNRADVADARTRVEQHPTPVLYDHLIGEAVEPKVSAEEAMAPLTAFLEKTDEERMDFWRDQMSRCIRCYACRNACPMCVCKDHCIAMSREPKWVSQEANVREKMMFQMIHALHLAGRCTGCGECMRACPMDIPVGLFKMMLNREVKQVFDYEAGIDPEATPPLYTFKVEEDKIEEREF